MPSRLSSLDKGRLRSLENLIRRIRPEWLFFVVGLLLLAKAGTSLLAYVRFQHLALADSFAQSEKSLQPPPLWHNIFWRPSLDHRVVATIGVPRIGMSVAVVEGIDDQALSIAAGHMPGTASFGAPGNAVVAAHRDLGFHPLRKVRLGDLIEVGGQHIFSYRIDRIQIVDPDATEVLARSSDPTLTLITCYPFGFIGMAPKRFVVHATLIPQS